MNVDTLTWLALRITGGAANVLALLLVAISLVSVALQIAGRVAAPTAARRPRMFRLELLFAVGLGIFGVLFVASDRAARAYASDPSCDAGATSAPAGPCSREAVTIARAFAVQANRSSNRYLDLVEPDGSTIEVVAELGPRDPLFLALRRRPETLATATQFRGTIARIATPYGTVETLDSPEIARSRFGLLAIGCGCMATALALRLGLRGPYRPTPRYAAR